VDTIALASLRNIDVMSFHLYPDYWGFDSAWGTEWINRHFADALAIRKPAMLGEYGLLEKQSRNRVYQEWTDATLDVGGAGALYWLLPGLQDDHTPYPDYDGFSVYCPGGVCETLGRFATMMTANRRLPFGPAPDDDVARTISVTPVTLPILANDVTYDGAVLDAATIDLDPATPGYQTTFPVTGGTYQSNLDGTVTFVATPGFVGNAVGSYLVWDSAGRVSSPATMTVTVDPDPNSSRLLFSFEDGADGWRPLNNAADGTTEQSADYASLGNFSLKVSPTRDDWFGAAYASPVDLSGKTRVSWEVRTTSSGTSQELVLQTGAGWDWCQAGTFEWVNADTTKTMAIDLTTIVCNTGAVDLSQVHALYVYLGNGGTGPIYLDNVRAD
jgi:mannan endo-1,4-beta-mannosidase